MTEQILPSGTSPTLVPSGTRIDHEMNVAIPGCNVNPKTIAPRARRGRPQEGGLETFPAIDLVDQMIEKGASPKAIHGFIRNFEKDEEDKPVYHWGISTVNNYVHRKKVAMSRSGKPLMAQKVDRIHRHQRILEAKKRADELFFRATNVNLPAKTDLSTESHKASEMLDSETNQLIQQSAVHMLSGTEARMKGLAVVWQMLTVAEYLKDEGIQLEGLAPKTLKDWVDLCRLQLEGLKLATILMGEGTGEKDLAEMFSGFVKRIGMTPDGKSKVSGFKSVVKKANGSEEIVEGMHKVVGKDEE